jgi:hypothetical protein
MSKENTLDLLGICTCADVHYMTGVRLDRGTGVLDLQQTAREEISHMVGSQPVCKRCCH